jgi:hypothetical protein
MPRHRQKTGKQTAQKKTKQAAAFCTYSAICISLLRHYVSGDSRSPFYFAYINPDARWWVRVWVWARGAWPL